MTIEQRLEQLELQNQRIERQSQRIERKNKRLTVALTLMAIAMCAVVSFGFSGVKDRAYGAEVAYLLAGTIITQDLKVVTKVEFSKHKKPGSMTMDDFDKGVHISAQALIMDDGKNRGNIFELTPRGRARRAGALHRGPPPDPDLVGDGPGFRVG